MIWYMIWHLWVSMTVNTADNNCCTYLMTVARPSIGLQMTLFRFWHFRENRLLPVIHGSRLGQYVGRHAHKDLTDYLCSALSHHPEIDSYLITDTVIVHIFLFVWMIVMVDSFFVTMMTLYVHIKAISTHIHTNMQCHRWSMEADRTVHYWNLQWSWDE